MTALNGAYMEVKSISSKFDRLLCCLPDPGRRCEPGAADTTRMEAGSTSGNASICKRPFFRCAAFQRACPTVEMGTVAGANYRSKAQRKRGIRDACQEQRGYLGHDRCRVSLTTADVQLLLCTVEEAVHTLSQVESIFNAKYQEPYSYVFLNDEPFDEDFIQRTNVCAFQAVCLHIAYQSTSLSHPSRTLWLARRCTGLFQRNIGRSHLGSIKRKLPNVENLQKTLACITGAQKAIDECAATKVASSFGMNC